MWILLDNYDSFTHILHHYLLQLEGDCRVYKNDEISLATLQALSPSRIILSPGPETPLQAGITMSVIEAFHHTLPILGVCLGHQALGMFYGGTLAHAPQPMHGKQSTISYRPHPLFKGIEKPFTAMRYHSLCITDIPTHLQAIASSEDGVLQAMAHQAHKSIGMQFHPESIGTPLGMHLLRNWKAMYE